MSHALGHVHHDGRNFTQAAPLNLTPASGPLGGPRFVFLHFDSVSLGTGARLEIDLGYATDVFTAASGEDFWSRPISGATSPITIRIVGGSGSARLLEYGVGEPTETANPPGTAFGSRSNPDPFLLTNPYQEPIYETRLQCHPGFAWRNARCTLPTVSDAVRDRVRAATGIIVMAHDFGPTGGGHVSSCSGTLIAGDLFLTSRHCLTDPQGRDVRSASVTFGYETACDGTRPPGHNPRFFKVVEEVAASASEDWVVVRLDGAPGDLPQPLEMRDATLMAGETVFSMHHPNGSTKKTQAGTHGGGSTITGFDFAGGSSGSALFDSSGRLVRGPLSQGPLGNACTVSFSPLGGIKAALGNPPPPPVPLDVMLVFDRSGSMSGSAPPSGRSKLEEAQDAASLFVQLVREGAGDRLGLVTFSSSAGLDRPLGAAATAKAQLVGPAPFTTGQIGAITPGGLTSIGAGLGIAQLGYGASVGNDRAMLLFTDGLQNTAPMIEEVESFLGSTRLNVVGFGSDAHIDGPLLTRVAHEHGGHFTRAVDGLSLRKFFGLCFGNIFENGALADPEFVLRSDQAEETHLFQVCGEEQITVILGWDDPASPLRVRIFTPDGKQVAYDRIVREVRGRSWLFCRIPLPYSGERDGQWRLVVDRLQDQVRKGRKAAAARFGNEVRYFYLVTAVGGPTLRYLGSPRRIYTGDTLHPRVALKYGNGAVPRNAEIRLFVSAPTIALGRLTTDAGLKPPVTHGDAVDAFHATLQAVASDNGGVLPVGTTMNTLPMFDDGAHDDGAMEPDGVFNHPLQDFARVEGTYTFRAVATYGEGCLATREVQWSVHVQPGIDPGRTRVTLVDERVVEGGRRGTLVLVPQDGYGNPLGPGRGTVFTVTPFPGVDIVGTVRDHGDGSYGVDVAWDPGSVDAPGVLLQQPDRAPVPMTPERGEGPDCVTDCGEAASAMLNCLGLHDPSVERVRVTRVSVEIDLKDTCARPCKGEQEEGDQHGKPRKPKPERDCDC
jgi:hypothetical protein